MVKIAINGLGRIGRSVARALVEEGYAHDIQLVAINAPAQNKNHAHLLQYDSVHGRFQNKIHYDETGIDIGFGLVPVTHERDVSKLDWAQYDVDILLECSGRFNSKSAALAHVQQGAKRVILSAPAKDDCKTIVFGVNENSITADDQVISAGSCTTNALAPLAKILHDTFGIETGFMTTVHAYTGDQNLVDGSHSDLRRARAAALSMIPTKTGAAKAIGLVLPELAGRLQGVAVRVPTPNVSLVDLVVNTKKPLDMQAVHQAVLAASETSMKGVLALSDAPLVSIDYTHHTASCIVDLTATHIMGEHMLRMAAWYDNEWGFSCRMLDLVKKLAR
jgi:glyceraldehyde 3-phosphate dehydrogenase